MTLQKPAFYDPLKSYEANYTDGPLISPSTTHPDRDLSNAKLFEFLGHKISLPFGIPPGPLLNSQFMEAAFDFGFDVSTYKTVRADAFPCHPFPNVLFVNVENDLHPDQTPRLIATSKEPKEIEALNITNSFGVPSMSSPVWQKDVAKALTYVKPNQLMILSFMGTVKPHQTQDEFVDDFANAARLAAATGAQILEANLSCPNIGNEGLVCYNIDVSEAVCKAIRKVIGDLPLILKIGYYKDEDQLAKFASMADKYAQAIAAINTLQVEVVNKDGQQALPGPMRLRSGVCGSSIRWAGLEMVKRLYALKQKNNYSYEIMGVGGVLTKDDYAQYRQAGADVVQSATGAMWNPLLAYEIWNYENS
jgi:dihydroorotate dehydrogenase